jgi:hypothetical protein
MVFNIVLLFFLLWPGCTIIETLLEVSILSGFIEIHLTFLQENSLNIAFALLLLCNPIS